MGPDGEVKADQGANHKFGASPPQVSLPKGGDAILDIGEKFAANPVTGTRSMSVPITTSPGSNAMGSEGCKGQDMPWIKLKLDNFTRPVFEVTRCNCDEAGKSNAEGECWRVNKLRPICRPVSAAQ
jgi:hypothetical protein